MLVRLLTEVRKKKNENIQDYSASAELLKPNEFYKNLA